MKVAILGCHGQVGSEAMERAAALGLDAVGIARAQIDLAQATVQDLSTLFNKLQCRAAINCAAYTDVAQAEALGDAPERNPNWEVNARLPGMLGQACAELGIPLVHLSTDHVFDGSKGKALTESDEPHPLNAYGRAKLEGEARLLASGAASSTLRAAAIFGPKGTHNFPSKILAAAKRLASLEVVGDQTCSPVPASDCAIAALVCAQRLAQRLPTPPLMHLASDRALSFHAFAREIISLALKSGLPLRCKPENVIATTSTGHPVPRPTDSRLDGALFQRSFAHPAFSLDEGLRLHFESFNLAPSKERA